MPKADVQRRSAPSVNLCDREGDDRHCPPIEPEADQFYIRTATKLSCANAAATIFLQDQGWSHLSASFKDIVDLRSNSRLLYQKNRSADEVAKLRGEARLKFSLVAWTTVESLDQKSAEDSSPYNFFKLGSNEGFFSSDMTWLENIFKLTHANNVWRHKIQEVLGEHFKTRKKAYTKVVKNSDGTITLPPVRPHSISVLPPLKGRIHTLAYDDDVIGNAGDAALRCLAGDGDAFFPAEGDAFFDEGLAPSKKVCLSKEQWRALKVEGDLDKIAKHNKKLLYLYFKHIYGADQYKAWQSAQSDPPESTPKLVYSTHFAVQSCKDYTQSPTGEGVKSAYQVLQDFRSGVEEVKALSETGDRLDADNSKFYAVYHHYGPRDIVRAFSSSSRGVDTSCSSRSGDVCSCSVSGGGKILAGLKVERSGLTCSDAIIRKLGWYCPALLRVKKRMNDLGWGNVIAFPSKHLEACHALGYSSDDITDDDFLTKPPPTESSKRVIYKEGAEKSIFYWLLKIYEKARVSFGEVHIVATARRPKYGTTNLIGGSLDPMHYFFLYEKEDENDTARYLSRSRLVENRRSCYEVRSTISGLLKRFVEVNKKGSPNQLLLSRSGSALEKALIGGLAGYEPKWWEHTDLGFACEILDYGLKGQGADSFSKFEEVYRKNFNEVSETGEQWSTEKSLNLIRAIKPHSVKVMKRLDRIIDALRALVGLEMQQALYQERGAFNKICSPLTEKDSVDVSSTPPDPSWHKVYSSAVLDMSQDFGSSDPKVLKIFDSRYPGGGVTTDSVKKHLMSRDPRYRTFYSGSATGLPMIFVPGTPYVAPEVVADKTIPSSTWSGKHGISVRAHPPAVCDLAGEGADSLDRPLRKWN